MGFDTDKFKGANYIDRTENVPVPRLKEYYAEDEKPIWVIRGLTGIESAISQQAAQENRNIEAILKAIGSKIGADITAAVEELANLNDEKVPDELVKRYVWLRIASIDPVCDHEMAMKLAHNHCEDFYLITNKIMGLTGQGRLGE